MRAISLYVCVRTSLRLASNSQYDQTHIERLICLRHVHEFLLHTASPRALQYRGHVHRVHAHCGHAVSPMASREGPHRTRAPGNHVNKDQPPTKRNSVFSSSYFTALSLSLSLSPRGEHQLTETVHGTYLTVICNTDANTRFSAYTTRTREYNNEKKRVGHVHPRSHFVLVLGILIEVGVYINNYDAL